jgi:hypothetical protein
MNVGVMKDYKLRDLHASHTLGWSCLRNKRRTKKNIKKRNRNVVPVSLGVGGRRRQLLPKKTDLLADLAAVSPSRTVRQRSNSKTFSGLSAMSSAFGPAIYILLAASATWSLSDLFALLPPLAVTK